MNDCSVLADDPTTGVRPAVAALVMALALALVGCGDGSVPADGTIPTVTEDVRADVPTLEPQQAAQPSAPTDGPASTEDGAGAGPPTPSAGAEGERFFGIDVADIADALAEDPDLAGERGEDLLEELRRVLDRPDDRKRIERAIERTDRWVGEGELDPGLAAATTAALEDMLAAAGEDPRDRDDEDDDDDEDD